jgi:Replication-relaxation
MTSFAAPLSARDLQILDTLDQHRRATSGQLVRLHFADGLAAYRDHRARRTMLRLEGWRLVSATKLPIGSSIGGSRGFLYRLSSANEKDVNARQLPHTLALTELYARLVEAGRAGILELNDVIPEPRCHQTIGPVELRPDDIIRIGVGTRYRRCFVELDRDSESGTEIGRKLSAYTTARNLWPKDEVFPHVLFVVQHDLPEREARRAEALTRIIQAHPAGHLFRVCRFDQAITALVGAGPSTAIRRPA